MNTSQQAALELLAGRALTQGEVDEIAALLPNRQDGAIAAILSVGRPPLVVPHHITRRGVSMVAALPRHRKALLDTLKAAATEVPAWFFPTLTALGIPEEDHQALADDLAIADYWLSNADGLDIGASGSRSMLDMIAVGVPAAAPACVAIKALAERPDPVRVNSVSDALNKAGA